MDVVVPEAWEPIPTYEEWWTPFDDRYHFHPQYAREPRPGITEPEHSVTFSIEPIYTTGTSEGFGAATSDLNAEVLRAFVEVFGADECLVVLDWQHQGYRFRPHLQAAHGDEWRVTPWPDGDYYIFLSEDLTSGTFGHPWEQSLCVFGRRLVDVLAARLESRLPVLRRGGQPE